MPDNGTPQCLSTSSSVCLTPTRFSRGIGTRIMVTGCRKSFSSDSISTKKKSQTLLTPASWTKSCCSQQCRQPSASTTWQNTSQKLLPRIPDSRAVQFLPCFLLLTRFFCSKSNFCLDFCTQACFSAREAIFALFFARWSCLPAKLLITKPAVREGGWFFM